MEVKQFNKEKGIWETNVNQEIVRVYFGDKIFELRQDTIDKNILSIKKINIEYEGKSYNGTHCIRIRPISQTCIEIY